MMQKGQVLIFLLIGILIIAIAGGFLFYTNYRSSVSNRTNNRYKTNSQNPVVTSQTPQSTLASSTNTSPTSVPSVPSTPITSCQEITSSGNYSLSQDIEMKSNRCLNIHDVNNINIDCQNHSVTTGQAENIRILKVQNFSVKNCNLVINLSVSNPEGGEGIVIDNSNSGILEKNMILHGGINIRRSNNIQILSNTVNGHSPFNQYKSSFNKISGNKFTADPVVAGKQIGLSGGGFIGSGGADGVVTSDGGSNNTIENNVIDGSSDGISHTEGNIGADDGILFAGGEKNTSIIGNTIKNIWDCGFENIAPIQDIQITKNKINNTGVCGIGGWYWNSWLRITVDSNVIDGVPTMFYLYRANGLLNEQDGLKEQNVYFQDNIFSNNTFSNPKIIPGKKVMSASINFENIPPEIPASAIKLGNNIFKNNDFGPGVESPFITPSNMIIDQKDK